MGDDAMHSNAQSILCVMVKETHLCLLIEIIGRPCRPMPYYAVTSVLSCITTAKNLYPIYMAIS